MPQAHAPSHKVTLKDVAAACGVSRATVSLVLRGSPLVNIRTRERVEAELQRQGYVYNRAAANLRRRTSSSVALVLNDLGNPFFAEFAAGVDQTLGEAGYVTLLGSTGESVERQQSVLGSLMEHGPAGIILSPAEGSDASRLFATVGGYTSLLLFNREPDGVRPPSARWDLLSLDNHHGSYLATMHLIEQGHRHIAFYGGHRGSSSRNQRLEGYLAAMHESGIEAPAHWQVECEPTRSEAAHNCGAVFAHKTVPTAAVCYNDAVALGLMLGLRQRGIEPGVGFAVTGFDDIAEAALSTPSLTTLATEPRVRGRQAACMLLKRLRKPETPPETIVAPAQLVVRASSNALHIR